jgi:hypothetical protein
MAAFRVMIEAAASGEAASSLSGFPPSGMHVRNRRDAKDHRAVRPVRRGPSYGEMRDEFCGGT